MPILARPRRGFGQTQFTRTHVFRRKRTTAALLQRCYMAKGNKSKRRNKKTKQVSKGRAMLPRLSDTISLAGAWVALLNPALLLLGQFAEHSPKCFRRLPYNRFLRHLGISTT